MIHSLTAIAVFNVEKDLFINSIFSILTISMIPQFFIKSSLAPQILLQDGLLFYIEKKFVQACAEGGCCSYYYLTCVNAFTKKRIKSVVITPYVINQYSKEESLNTVSPPKLFFANHTVFVAVSSSFYCYRIQPYGSRVKLLKRFRSIIIEGVLLPSRDQKLVLFTQDGFIHLYSLEDYRVIKEYQICNNIQRVWCFYDLDSSALFFSYETWQNGLYQKKFEVIPLLEDFFKSKAINLNDESISISMPIGRVSNHLLVAIEINSSNSSRKLQLAYYNLLSNAIEIIELFNGYELLHATLIEGKAILHVKEIGEVNSLLVIDNAGTIISRQELEINSRFVMKDAICISKKKKGLLTFNKINFIKIGEIPNDILVASFKFP